MRLIERWLAERPTPILWVIVRDSDETSAVESEVRRTVTNTDVMRLSSFGPEEAFNQLRQNEREPLTTKVLLQFAAERSLVVLDGLDSLQQSVGQKIGTIIDCRFRQLLLTAGTPALKDTGFIVTSRLAPPPLISQRPLTVVELPETIRSTPTSLPPPDSIERRVWEFASLSRRAVDAATLARMSRIDEPTTRSVLQDLVAARIVDQANTSFYRVPEWARALLAENSTRAKSIREAAIEALQESASDPERLLDMLMDEGRVDLAVDVYWYQLGNFSRLHQDGLNHLGAQLCQRLNDGLGPEELSPRLKSSEGVWAVMNDWSQFAKVCGDAETSAISATRAYETLPEDVPKWNTAMVAVHAAQAYYLAGNLESAMTWCKRAWEHARAGMRSTQGVAVREVMEAYDLSATTIAQIYLRFGASAEIRRLIDDLTAIHDYARQSVSEFDASSIIPLGSPSGKVVPDELADGRLPAMLALSEGRFEDLGSRATTDPLSVFSGERHTLLMRAEPSTLDDEQVHAMHSSLRNDAENRDDCAAQCELAVLMQAHAQKPDERLATTEAYLGRAEACGLAMYWRDLQLARSQALKSLGRLDDARSAAEAVLFGARDVLGACAGQDWPAARAAVSLLSSLGGTVADTVKTTVERAGPPSRESPRKAIPRRPSATGLDPVIAREAAHSAALKVLQAREIDGTPLVLFFRSFHIDVLHGPMELGPKLLENALRDALPENVEVLTIQEHSPGVYAMGSTRLQREAPALLLADDEWANIVRLLIPAADLIVSEALMLSEGVRLELQMICDADRWDRTVLVLPPHQSALAVIDNDTLIQMFPRCVWADSLHQTPLTDSPVIADLLERIRAISSLPIATSRTLGDGSARDTAYPIDLSRVAHHFKTEAMHGSVFAQDDKTMRYYAFWQLFRASAIWGLKYRQGDDSLANRCQLAHAYIEMSKLMLDHTKDGERIILLGDPAEAKLMVKSGYALLADAGDDLLATMYRNQAEDLWEELVRLEQAMQENPLRFEVRPEYGPLVKKKV